MKLVLACVAALLWQVGDFGTRGANPTPAADPQHLRYERALTVQPGSTGVACAVLDADVFAHAASASAGDLRIFRSKGLTVVEEIPFVVSYSQAQPSDAMIASAENRSFKNGDIAFDLAMPPRAYTLVNLQLGAHNFIAKASVFGDDQGRSDPLGTFTLFDLTRQHLARSTSLALQESHFSRLHISLHMLTLDGKKFPHLSSSIVEGASVPASREAQTLYRSVATTSDLRQTAQSTVARLIVPAHVPIERVRFVLDPSYKADFLRDVSIDAVRIEKGVSNLVEGNVGEIWRVTRSADDQGVPAIHAAKLAVSAVIESNSRQDATLTVAIQNAADPPLPIKEVLLEMRQRTICFNTAKGSTYTLRYGDDVLHASVYDLDGSEKIGAKTQNANLGPEHLNPHYIQRDDGKTTGTRGRETYWLVTLTAIAVFGAIASRHTKRRGRRG